MCRGRPLKFKTVKQLEQKIEEYFDSISIISPVYQYEQDGLDEKGNAKFKKIPMLNKNGEQIFRTEFIDHPSILAMAHYLGTTRKTLLDYEHNEEFCYTIKRAKERIEIYLENQLYRKDQVTGIIFNLKNNFGWVDKQEIEQSGGTDSKLTINFKIPRPKEE